MTYGSADGLFNAVNGMITGEEGNFSALFADDGLYLVGSLEGGASPPFISAIDDIRGPEDTTFALKLRGFDPDGDALIFTATADTSAVQLAIALDTLKITFETNWNGAASIKAMVSDGGLMDTTDFTVTLTPVQDKPLAFDLLEPANDSIVVITDTTNLNQPFTLSWAQAVDPDGEQLAYYVIIEDTLEILLVPGYGTMDTSLSWYYSDILTNMQIQGYTSISGTWTVKAKDKVDSTYAANGPFRLTFVDGIVDSPVGIEDGLGIPTEFALHPAYPNPFNPSTTIRFDLPEAAEVHLVVYDILGREVIQLVNERLEPGYRQVTWNGRTARGGDVPTGIYIARLVTPQYTRSIKMVLLK